MSYCGCSNSDGAQNKTENDDAAAEQKRIEKARLRLELQHRRKIKQLHRRLENRKLKQAGVKTHVIIAAPAAAAAAESTETSKKKKSRVSPNGISPSFCTIYSISFIHNLLHII